MRVVERKKCWKNYCNIFFGHIGNTTDRIWKNTLVSDLSVLLNDIRDNIEHITIFWLFVINYIADVIAFYHSLPYLVSILPFSGRMCYPKFAVRIIYDKSVYLTTNIRQSLTTKWSLTRFLSFRGLVKAHLAAIGCLGFVVI